MTSRKNEPRCTFCTSLPKDCGSLVSCEAGVFICAGCAKKALDATASDNKKRGAKKTKIAIPAPVEIFAHLNEYVIGQSHAKKQLSIAVSNHYKRILSSGKQLTCDDADLADVEIEKSNILLIGPTGSGKTLLAKTLARFLNVPFAIGDATTITEAGYVGEDVENLLLKLLKDAEFDLALAEKGVLYIDEIDKLRKTGGNVSITRDVSGEGVQQSLLKMIEGTVSNIPPQGGRKHPEQQCISMNTTDILFILGGAFVGLDDIIRRRVSKSSIGFSARGPRDKNDTAEKNQILRFVSEEDLIQFGLIPELVGRVPIISTLDELDVSDMVKVLTEPKNCLIKQFQKLCSFDSINLKFTDEAITEIATQAKAKGTGARGLRSVIESVMEDILFEPPVGGSIKIDRAFVVERKHELELRRGAA